MRWFSIVRSLLALSAALALVGCGSSGFDSNGGQDSLTMQFQTFSGEGITQEDLVGNTDADVDVCQSICNFTGDLVNIEFESFTQTRANAIFMNMGASPILLDKYTVTIPNSGVPARTATVAAASTATAGCSPPATTSKHRSRCCSSTSSPRS